MIYCLFRWFSKNSERIQNVDQNDETSTVLCFEELGQNWVWWQQMSHSNKWYSQQLLKITGDEASPSPGRKGWTSNPATHIQGKQA